MSCARTIPDFSVQALLWHDITGWQVVCHGMTWGLDWQGMHCNSALPEQQGFMLGLTGLMLLDAGDALIW